MIEDFYPTPKALINKMLSGIDVDKLSTILEPSAGKGDICDALKRRLESNYNRGCSIDVIEINPDLQHILRGKGFNLVQDDFLSFQTSKCYDLIIANFPFSEGDKHLLKVLLMLERNGGQLVCLVNAETLRNPYTNLRQSVQVQLERFEAQIEFLPGEFVNAERKTDVECALIRATVEKQPADSFILDNLLRSKSVEVADAWVENSIVERDFKRAMVSRFEIECQAGVRLIEEWKSLVPHIQTRHQKKGEKESDHSSPLIELKVKDHSGWDTRPNLINGYLRGVRYKYWEILINDPRYTGQYTSNITDDLHRKLDELRNFDFNIFNIDQLARDLELRVSKGVEDAILKLFDKLSTKFAWDESIHNKNVHYYNGWKTNKAWKINSKVILPMNGINAGYGHGRRFQYQIDQELADMVKVFNYLAPQKVDVWQLVGRGMESAERNQDFNVDLRYFSTKFYKKGTCHITFHDQELLDKFNIFGSQRKGWLPPSYGKHSYDEMKPEDRAVIDEFQGEASYGQVMANKDFYLVEDTRGLLSESTDQ